ncbi:Peptidyl-tRNA hydrolase ArfB [Planctomycetes bacterium MalM25]|nr:Peptidyl-tRNA hydrolase ArfB [Planctomycetes bacterium MalM25]
MQSDLVINERLAIPRSEIQFSFARSAGPGGQNVNKVNTKAVLRWRPSASASLPAAVRQRLISEVKNRLTREGDLIITSDRHREQGRNVGECLQRLKALVSAAAKPPKRRRPTRPTRASKERRLNDKRANAAKKSGRRQNPEES